VECWWDNVLSQASVITSKAAIHYHFKTGQRTFTQNKKMLYRAGYDSGKCFFN